MRAVGLLLAMALVAARAAAQDGAAAEPTPSAEPAAPSADGQQQEAQPPRAPAPAPANSPQAAAPANVPAATPKPAPAQEQAAPGPTPPLPAANAPTSPATNAPGAAAYPASPAAAGARRFQRWSPQEIARVRAMLARQRQSRPAKPRARRHGDPLTHFTAGLDVSAVARPDEGFEHFDQGHTGTRFGVFMGYDLVRITESLSLMGELGAGIEHAESRDLLGDGAAAALDSQTFDAGLVLRWDALSWLAPQLRAWGGASLFQLEVTGTAVPYDKSHATSAFGALGAGVFLHTPARTFETAEGSLASFQLGLLIEAGYALRSAIDLDLHTRPDPHRIDVIDASLGSLRLSGAYLRLAPTMRF